MLYCRVTRKFEGTNRMWERNVGKSINIARRRKREVLTVCCSNAATATAAAAAAAWERAFPQWFCKRLLSLHNDKPRSHIRQRRRWRLWKIFCEFRSLRYIQVFRTSNASLVFARRTVIRPRFVTIRIYLLTKSLIYYIQNLRISTFVQ